MQDMRFVGLIAAVLCALLLARGAEARETFIQIEALPTLAEGEARARAYGGVFPNVNGFRLGSGWYAIAIGPFTPEEAVRQLGLLRGERMIPNDSYIPESAALGERFWPVGAPEADAETATAEPLTEAPGTEAIPEETGGAPEPEPEPVPEPVIDETPREARASEALLDEEARKGLQTALQWFGLYAGTIDGAFGAGTRKSMGDWQAARGYEETGILTTRQREELLASYRGELSALGLELVTDREAGIEIELPTAMVEFDHYEPPFVHYRARGTSGVRVILISQQGDAATLFGLYDLMQTLEIVPLDGERERKATSFVINATGPTVASYTQAALEGGLIKGFALVWDPRNAANIGRVLDAMKASFRPIGDRALDDSLGQPLAEEKKGLLAGLEVRRPQVSRSGFFVDATGMVLTTTEVLGTCGRLTIDGEVEADVALQDGALGLALLKPRIVLAPRAVAVFQTANPRLNAEVAVAGYSYEDALDAPAVTFGTVEDTRGLDGEENLKRLAIAALPGDAGGPVLDTSGSVVGMLLPRAEKAGRVLPEDVVFALDAAAIATRLAEAGTPPVPTGRSGAMSAEKIAEEAARMTVLVSCWE
jgi:S1-C subfamily serine protease